MKTLSPVQLCEMLPEKIPSELELVEMAIPIECREPGQMRRMILEGFITPQLILNDDRPSHLLGWHLSPDGTFWVDLLIALGNPVPFSIVEQVVTGFALSKGAKCLRCSTVRPGLAKWARAAGWKPEMVVLTKVL